MRHPERLGRGHDVAICLLRQSTWHGETYLTTRAGVATTEAGGDLPAPQESATPPEADNGGRFPLWGVAGMNRHYRKPVSEKATTPQLVNIQPEHTA